MQVTIVTSLSEEYHHCYKLYQDYRTTHIFFPALYMLWNVLIVLLLCHVIQFCLYFTLAKHGVKCNCIYDMFVPVIVFQNKKKKKKNLYVSMGKNQKLCHNCPTIYLFSWVGEGNPYISNPVNTLKKKKKLKSAPSDLKIPMMHLFRLPVCW